ncbi:tandem-95 repeat protein [Sphingobium amiense]|uniref:Tandem-95 repeat protein n=1 Tax=Sphingobium amiense TaxID=135719 RepID=A0A494W0Q6_9SPHN|nr:tandem-95 repeat protein [Sphingobium amiense]BBD98243.1 tandem-95 repeat protein [Sphingobium amiense]
MTKNVTTATAARAKVLGRAKDHHDKQAAQKQAHDEAAAAEAAAYHSAAVLPQGEADELQQAVPGTLAPDASLAGDFSFANVMADVSGSMAGSAGMFGGEAFSFAQASGGADAGAGVGGGGVSTPLIIGGVVAAGGLIAIAASGGDDDDNDTVAPPPPPPANTAPTVAATQTVAGTEDAAATVTVSATDAENNALTYSAAGAQNGTVTGGQDGVFTYTPNANFNGTDTFTVTVTDSAGASSTQTVTVNLAAVNDAPTIDASATRAFSVVSGASQAFTISASDVDGDALTASISPTDGPANGTIDLATNTYTANAGFVGTDDFTIQVSDGTAVTEYTVTVNVTAPPSTGVTINAAGTSDASAGDVTYTVEAGNYVHTISGFGAGDEIVSPAGNPGTLNNSDFTDGQATIQYANSGQVTQIVLTGLTRAQDEALFGPSDLNTVFGAGTFA